METVPTAVATVSRSSAAIVRRSSQSRPSSIRATMGTGARRRARSSWSASGPRRVAASGLDRGAAAGEDAGLRPTEQLVARERDEVGAGGDGLGDGGLVGQAPPALGLAVDQRARAEVDHGGDPARAADRDQLAGGD